MTQKALNEIAAETEEFDVHTKADRCPLTGEHHLHHVARQIRIPTYSQPAVLVSCHSAMLMTLETHPNVVERQCAMNTEGLMHILPGKLFYLYIANLTAKPVGLLRFMISASAFNTISCIIQARYDERCTTENRGQASTQCYSSSSVHAVHYKPQEHRGEQVDRRNAENEPNGNANLSWQYELKVSNEYVLYHHDVVKVLS